MEKFTANAKIEDLKIGDKFACQSVRGTVLKTVDYPQHDVIAVRYTDENGRECLSTYEHGTVVSLMAGEFARTDQFAH